MNAHPGYYIDSDRGSFLRHRGHKGYIATFQESATAEDKALLKAAPSLLTAAIAARAVIREDRKVWFDSNVNRTDEGDGEVDADAAICLDHYDVTLAMLDTAIAAAMVPA